MASDEAGKISRERVRELIEAGEIDTVINAVCDMQGRLVGKRITGSFFREHGAEAGTHFCTYLLATDMEMKTPEGFPLANWQSGYGDYLARPDWQTARIIPWLEKTALVLADAVDDATGELVPIAPRTILRRQIERAAALGFSARMASELEFYLLRQTYEDARSGDYATLQPAGWYNEDYQLLQATRGEPLYRRLRNLLTEAGVPIEFSKGEAAAGQHEINIHYADALEAADRHVLLKHGAKEMAIQQGWALTFMAKPAAAWTGNSGHIHISLWDTDGQQNRFADPAAPDGMSATMRHFLGGLMAGASELSLLIAPNVNSYKRYAVESWAPVHIVWGRDNRSCGFRIVGHGSSLRIENRFPGGDANPYLAYAAVLGIGLTGIERAIEPPPEYQGNGYLASDQPRVPRTLADAIDAFATSELAREIFGDLVVAHYLNAARVEQAAFDAAVTDWERRRYFERG